MAQIPNLPSDASSPAPVSDGSEAPGQKRGTGRTKVRKLAGAGEQCEPREEQPAGDPLAELIKKEAREAGPWFAASLVLHIVILTVLGFIVMRQERKTEAAHVPPHRPARR